MFSLKELFDKEVIVTMDPSWNVPWPVKGAKTHAERLWYYEIVGKRGKIYPQTETEVTVTTTHRIGKKLVALFREKCRTRRDCDESIDVVIPVDLIKSTFRYIKPRYRKQLSEAQKEALKARFQG